jgi:hypothetical protein
MIGDGDQYGVQYPPLAIVWQPSAMQQKNGIREIGARHQIGDVIAVNPNVGIVRSSDRGAPVVHGVLIIRLLRGGCAD